MFSILPSIDPVIYMYMYMYLGNCKISFHNFLSSCTVHVHVHVHVHCMYVVHIWSSGWFLRVHVTTCNCSKIHCNTCNTALTLQLTLARFMLQPLQVDLESSIKTSTVQVHADIQIQYMNQ